MSDETRFYDMTRPIRFRTLRKIFQSVGHTYEVGIERVKYLTNNILYKLNILKRYSYRDNVERFIPLTTKPKMKHITTDNVRCSVSSKLLEVESFDIDYFYRTTKTGEKKITYSVKDNCSKDYILVFTPQNIILRVAQKWFDVKRLPIFKVSIPVNSENIGEYKTITLNTKKLTDLRVKYFLGKDLVVPEDIPNSVLDYYGKVACRDLENYLNGISLHDLMIGDE